MPDMVLAIAVAGSAFIATNLDNLVLLVALFGRYSDRRYEVVFGYFSAMAVILGTTFLVGRIAGNAPVNYLGLLGIFPVLIGLVELGRLFRNRGGIHSPVAPGVGSTAVAAALMTQLSNSADTIVTFSVLFSDSNDFGDLLVFASFGVMALLWVLIAQQTLRHPWLSRPIQLYGHYITPLILIAVGLFVLSNTALDMLPGS